MAVLSPMIVRGLVSPLQALVAFVMIITGIFDRVRHVIVPSYILMPVWTGVLILITAGLGVAVGTKSNIAPTSALVITYRALNISLSILCGFIVYWYGAAVATYAYGKASSSSSLLVVVNGENFAVVATIFLTALIEIFLSILGTLASQNRKSSYMQLADSPYYNQTEMQEPPMQVVGNNLARPGAMQGATYVGAVAYQPMPQDVFQTGTPVMMAPAYFNQMATTNAPVMLVPAQNMQQMPGSSGGGLTYVQVPANQVLSGRTEVSAPSQVPEVATYPSGPQRSEEISGVI